MKNHLTETQIKKYAKNLLEGEEREYANKHINNCTICADKMVSFIENDFENSFKKPDLLNLGHPSEETMTKYKLDLLDETTKQNVVNHINYCKSCKDEIDTGMLD